MYYILYHGGAYKMFGLTYEYLKTYELNENELSQGNEFYKNERNYNKLAGSSRDTIRDILLNLPFFRLM